jgi:aurora kinase
MTNRACRSLSELSLVQQIGAGAASVVYYALCRRSHQPLAVKLYHKAKLSVLNKRQVLFLGCCGCGFAFG